MLKYAYVEHVKWEMTLEVNKPTFSQVVAQSSKFFASRHFLPMTSHSSV
jgi:hypothetical protein